MPVALQRLTAMNAERDAEIYRLVGEGMGSRCQSPHRPARLMTPRKSYDWAKIVVDGLRGNGFSRGVLIEHQQIKMILRKPFSPKPIASRVISAVFTLTAVGFGLSCFGA